MADVVQCVTCLWENESGIQVDTSKSKRDWAAIVGVNEASIRRHLNHPPKTASVDTAIAPGSSSKHDEATGVSEFSEWAEKPWGKSDFEEFVIAKGEDLANVTLAYGVTSAPNGGFWNKLMVRPKSVSPADIEPKWPVIQPAAPVIVRFDSRPVRPARDGLKLSLKCADTQIGFRELPDGTREAFHDWDAMNVFVEVCRQEQPETIVILGDFLDLPSNGKYIQEAGFARMTQPAIDDGHLFLSMLRGVCPNSEIHLVEGNHDKRLQNFIELNALAAYGLRRANMPDEWPVMSLQNLLRLDELDIVYYDAYPAAVYWENEDTQNIHGTRANSKGSTMSQYIHELPHINTWAGHTHRVEVIYRSVKGPRGEAIESYSANPGCLAKTDGTVPSVHSALHSDGTSAKVVEDWQQGFGSLLYSATEAWSQVWRIKNGKAFYNGRVIG